MEGGFGVAREHGHPALGDYRSGIHPVVDDDDARAGLGDAGGQGVPHAVHTREFGEVRRVGVDQVGAEGRDHPRWQQFHKAAEDHEIRLPDTDLLQHCIAPALPVLEARECRGEGGDAVGLRMLESVGIPIRSDRNDACRELGVFRGLEKRAQVRPSAGDQHDQ